MTVTLRLQCKLHLNSLIICNLHIILAVTGRLHVSYFRGYDAHPHGTAGISLYYRNRISCYILRNRPFFDDSSKYNVISDTYSATIRAPPQDFMEIE